MPCKRTCMLPRSNVYFSSSFQLSKRRSLSISHKQLSLLKGHHRKEIVRSDGRRWSYGEPFWMRQYQKLNEMFPNFGRNFKNQMKCGEISGYLQILKNKDGNLLSENNFRRRIGNILIYGLPYPIFQTKNSRIQRIRVTRKLPYHKQLMWRYRKLTLQKATDRYNDAIREYCEESNTHINSTVLATMRDWRTEFNSRKIRKWKKKRGLMIPKWLHQNETNAAEKQRYFHTLKRAPRRWSSVWQFWMHHLKALVRMYPNFLYNYEKGINHGEVKGYIKCLNERNIYCPRLYTFYRQLKHIFAHGEPKCGKGIWVAKSKKLPNHYRLMYKYRSLHVTDATRRYNKRIEKYTANSKTNQSVSLTTMYRWRKQIETERRITENTEPLSVQPRHNIRWKLLPNHRDLMEEYISMSAKKATANYNAEIRKYYGEQSGKIIQPRVMYHWRSQFWKNRSKISTRGFEDKNIKDLHL